MSIDYKKGNIGLKRTKFFQTMYFIKLCIFLITLYFTEIYFWSQFFIKDLKFSSLLFID